MEGGGGRRAHNQGQHNGALPARQAEPTDPGACANSSNRCDCPKSARRTRRGCRASMSTLLLRMSRWMMASRCKCNSAATTCRSTRRTWCRDRPPCRGNRHGTTPPESPHVPLPAHAQPTLQDAQKGPVQPVRETHAPRTELLVVGPQDCTPPDALAAAGSHPARRCRCHTGATHWGAAFAAPGSRG